MEKHNTYISTNVQSSNKEYIKVERNKSCSFKSSLNFMTKLVFKSNVLSEQKKKKIMK
jgi:hypothetical protein